MENDMGWLRFERLVDRRCKRVHVKKIDPDLLYQWYLRGYSPAKAFRKYIKIMESKSVK